MTDIIPARPRRGLAMRSLLRADAIVLLNTKSSLTIGVLLPVLILVATTFGKAQTRLGSPSLILGLALTLGLITSSLFGYTLTLAHDREAGVLQRLQVTPAPTWMIMTSRLLVQVIANVATSVVVVIVGVTVHGLNLHPGQYALLLAIAVLGAAMFLAIGQAIVALVKSTSTINAISRLLMGLLIVLGLTGGTGLLGDTIKAIADWSPVGALMTPFADALDLSPWTIHDTGSLLTGVLYVIVFAFIGMRWFRWKVN